MNAQEALQLLKEGNTRFVNEAPTRVTQTSAEQRQQLEGGQNPFAIILGCSDSRASVELLFDQNLGDLFVVRVAGNIANPALIGSVEFAAAQFGTRLVVVLGHSQCGAVKATLGEIEKPSGGLSPNITAIVDQIRAGVEPIARPANQEQPEDLLTQAIRANVSATAEKLRQTSPILKDLIANDGLQVVGAEYSLKTGEVEFFDGP